MTKINGPSPILHPAVKEAANEISSVYQERDSLLAANVELLRRAEVAEGVAAHLKEELREVTAQRDYYTRKSFALTNTLGSARTLIDSTLSLAEHEAEHPGPTRELVAPRGETADERVLREAETLRNAS